MQLTPEQWDDLRRRIDRIAEASDPYVRTMISVHLKAFLSALLRGGASYDDATLRLIRRVAIHRLLLEGDGREQLRNPEQERIVQAQYQRLLKGYGTMEDIRKFWDSYAYVETWKP